MIKDDKFKLKTVFGRGEGEGLMICREEKFTKKGMKVKVRGSSAEQTENLRMTSPFRGFVSAYTHSPTLLSTSVCLTFSLC